MSLWLALALVHPAAATPPNHIVGGRIAFDGEWPEVVALVDLTGGNSFCSGSLIAPDVVLTAAHCVDDLEGVELAIATGVAVEDAPVDVVPALGVTIHPTWVGSVGVGRDAAVVRLSRPPSDPLLASLNDAALHEGWVGTAVDLVGYGVTRDEGNDGGTQRHAPSLISAVDGDLVSYFDDQHQICFGDSGGPTFLEVGGGRVQVGIHSFISGGCTEGVGTDDRVDTLLGWLDELDIPVQTRPAGPPDFTCSHAYADDRHALGIAPFKLKCVVEAPDPETLLAVRWAWGDGGQGDGLAASHVYEEPGDYHVTMCADLAGEDGPWTWCASGRQRVTACGEPEISFVARPGADPLTIELENTSDVSVYGCTTHVEWTLFRGGQAEGEPISRVTAWEPSFAVDEPGTWTVKLTTAGYGGSSAAMTTLNVRQPVRVGCDQSGGAPAWLLLLPAVFGLRRRR